MFFSRLKISTKLIISSAVFLIPVGVMLFFICSITIEKINKSTGEHDGITALMPAVTALRNLPDYLNISLQKGNTQSLDAEISSAIRLLNREMLNYRTGDDELPDLLSEWDILKKTKVDGTDGSEDEAAEGDIFQKYLNFTRLITKQIQWIGERSGLLLVSDIDTYYFVSPALTGIPEAYVRLMLINNPFRKHFNNSQNLLNQYNEPVPEGAAVRTPIEADTENITIRNFGTILGFFELGGDFQEITNNRLLIISDKDRINSNIEAAINIISSNRRRVVNTDELSFSLEKYRESIDTLSASLSQFRVIGSRGGQQGGRQGGQQGGRQGGQDNTITVSELMENISNVNNNLCQLWANTFEQLDLQVQRNTSYAKIELVVYLLVVLVSLGIAICFVIFILLDVNRSVKNLKTLFVGLNENDLTLSLKITSKDEFGELMTAFNGFLDILRTTFGSFKQSAMLVSNSVFDISSASKEITATANEQSTSVSEIVSTMESSKNLSEQIALKTTEVAQLAVETQDLSSKGAELREVNQTMMEDIRKQNQKIISEIRNLSDMIVRISEAIRIIDGIADQTKLIAFNASLEASSSGESGSRFSVVASEIRRFADNVAESTQEIKQKIEEVQGASQILITEANSGSKQIEIGYERMSEQKAVFEQIVDNSQNVATRSQQISNLSRQQELASSQIFSALKEISAGVKQFVIATSSTAKIANSLNGMSEELKGRVDKYRTESES
ncbi:MAG: methyl-accepting chemotaxis protein [Treponema sp.]|nr:methyl-accepting chemotaxis protein [Treponema sp.]